MFGPSAALEQPCVEPAIDLSQIPELGACLPRLEETCTRTMVSPSQTWPAYSAVIDGVSYTVAVDRTEQVRFVATTDEAFTPPEGVHIGDPPAAALAVAPAEAIRHEPGWGYYVRMPSGWCAFIDDSYGDCWNLGTRPLGDKARITMFFMRD